MLSIFLGVLAALVVASQFEHGHLAAGLLGAIAFVALCGVVDVIVWGVRRMSAGAGKGKTTP